MFSGQGSQYYRMGKELYENHPRFKLWMDHCDEMIHPLTQTSLIEILYRKPRNKSEPFDQILYTNPALLCIEYSLTQVLMEMEIKPDYLLGYSLGEIIASVIGCAISLEEGIQVVVEFAKLLKNETRPAGMLAIIESTDIITQFPDLFQKCWLTGKNFQNNFVMSGLSEDIRYLQEALNQKNITSQRLPVNYGFHTELMDPLEEKFKQLVRRINFSSIRIPIISSLKAKVVQKVSDDYFWEVIRQPVEFEKTISWMIQEDDYFFIDVGPSGSLATFVKYLLPANSNSIHMEMMNQFGKDIHSLEKLRSRLLG